MSEIIPFSLKDAPALIERFLPVQKLSAEAYKEQMAHIGKTLTSLGSYWKGRKPLILNKAAILGCLLPVTRSLARDLEIYEKLMAMDDESFVARWPRRLKPKEILERISISKIDDYFSVSPDGILPASAPVDWSAYEDEKLKITWRTDVSELERRRLEFQVLPRKPYRQLVEEARRPEEVAEVSAHIWDAVNAHLGTCAQSFPELVEQLGVMRFGRRPKLGDNFCGSGQIPFEAGRLGCEVFASDLNPIACMLTWGAFNIVGGSEESRTALDLLQRELVLTVQAEIDEIGVEDDGKGWRTKVFLYCVEARCQQSGWLVPLLPTLVVSKLMRAVAELVPIPDKRRYDVKIRTGATDEELAEADTTGTIRTDGRGQDPFLIHCVNGSEFRTKISTLRGDYRRPDGSYGNQLRAWQKSDFEPTEADIFQERPYAIEWMRPKKGGRSFEYEFRSVTEQDLERERVVQQYVGRNLEAWQEAGYVPDMRIEPGEKTDEPIRTRGWTHWHHLFNARQLLFGALCMKHASKDARLLFGVMQALNVNARLSRWNNSRGGGGIVIGVFDNQALNTLFNYGCRGFAYAAGFLDQKFRTFPLERKSLCDVRSMPANAIDVRVDLFITDPPYGDAVKYEEILEFFIAWLRKSPPPEFSGWTWDSRRSLAIKGEDESFRREMVSSYKRMTECMPDNGIQVIMFTHQSGSIWADMANIVWASGLQVSAAWYVVTETESALRQGSNVKGTVLLVARKRSGIRKTTRGDLAWEIQEEVEKQVRDLSGLNQEAKGLYRDENVFEDADIQMAGYAAALRVLTRYAIIDGRDMTVEASRPRVKGEKTFVDGMIDFAVGTANQCLVPQGIAKSHWDTFTGTERFYLKLLDLEAKNLKTLDNYQNFAKAFKVADFRPLMANIKANQARLKSSAEFGKSEMSEGSALHQSPLRAVLYALMELEKNVDGNEVLSHLTLNIPDYYSNRSRRDVVIEIAAYLAKKLEGLRPQEARDARVLSELVKNQRLG